MAESTTFNSIRTTREIEARDTSIDPLTFRDRPDLPSNGVSVTSADGDIFIGTIVDVEEGWVYVELR